MLEVQEGMVQNLFSSLLVTDSSHEEETSDRKAEPS